MAVSQSLNSKATIKKSTTNDLPFSPSQPVLSSYYATSTASQTSIANLGFSIMTTGPFTNTDQFFLFVDGKKLDLGSSNDYTFTAIASDGTSSQVTFTSPLPANLNIQAFKLGLKKESEFLTDNRFTQLYAAQNVGFQGFIDTASFINTPTTTTGTPAAGTFYSSIANRASMVDLSQDLRARMGIERIMFQDMIILQSEYGPNGETVFGLTNDTFGQVRFIGNWTNPTDSNGLHATSSGVANVDSFEVTFYGTGLNLLMLLDATSRTSTYSVDGVGSTSITPATGSTILSARGYAENTVVKAASGLTLGIHTIRVLSTSANTLTVFGCEVLNESSSVKVNSGIGYTQGKQYVSAAQSSFLYSSPVTGTTGGRVLVYQKGDGTISQAFTACAASPSYAASANHTNEEVVRTYFWREFGASSATDFSTLTTGATSARAFTLDDGTTTLVGTAVNYGTVNNYDVLNQTAAATVYFTFIGTGLDISFPNSSLVGAFQANIDNAGNNVILTNPTSNQSIFKVASGLSYGTHTCALTYSTYTSGSSGIAKFIVYQPKTPSLPSGAIQLATYNVMANYTPATPGTNNLYIASGVLRKMVTSREAQYTPTWVLNAINTAFASGQSVDTVTSGSTYSYVFFGTGIILHTTHNNSAYNYTVSIDGSSNLTGTGTFAQSGSGLSFVAATGTVSGTASASDSAEVRVSGLTLGIHTILVTTNNTTQFFPDTLDIITPIHSPKSNLYAEFQNTLPIGSNALGDMRQTTPIKDAIPATKAWAIAIGAGTNPSTTSASPTLMPDMEVTVKTSGGPISIYWAADLANGNIGAGIDLAVLVDGVSVKSQFSSQPSGGNDTTSDVFKMNIGAGVHNVSLLWSTGAGTLSVTNRVLLVEET